MCTKVLPTSLHSALWPDDDSTSPLLSGPGRGCGHGRGRRLGHGHGHGRAGG